VFDCNVCAVPNDGIGRVLRLWHTAALQKASCTPGVQSGRVVLTRAESPSINFEIWCQSGYFRKCVFRSVAILREMGYSGACTGIMPRDLHTCRWHWASFSLRPVPGHRQAFVIAFVTNIVERWLVEISHACQVDPGHAWNAPLDQCHVTRQACLAAWRIS